MLEPEGNIAAEIVAAVAVMNSHIAARGPSPGATEIQIISDEQKERKDREGKGHKSQIWVAIIGVIGVLGAALIANWPTLFGPIHRPLQEPKNNYPCPENVKIDAFNKCLTSDCVVVPFTSGPKSVKTNKIFKGKVLINVAGTGQTSGKSYNDAFYVFTNDKGQLIDAPFYPDGFTLSINGKLAIESIVDKKRPGYASSHEYTFTIDIPEGPIFFGVDDLYTADNTGMFVVRLCSESR